MDRALEAARRDEVCSTDEIRGDIAFPEKYRISENAFLFVILDGACLPDNQSAMHSSIQHHTDNGTESPSWSSDP